MFILSSEHSTPVPGISAVNLLYTASNAFLYNETNRVHSFLNMASLIPFITDAVSIFFNSIPLAINANILLTFLIVCCTYKMAFVNGALGYPDAFVFQSIAHFHHFANMYNFF